jgi:hypothetical protein
MHCRLFKNCGPPRSARPETSKGPSCSEIEVIIRDFESGLGVFADDGAFAFRSRRDIELGARILYDHCVRWGMMPHTAGKTVAMYFGQPVVNLVVTAESMRLLQRFYRRCIRIMCRVTPTHSPPHSEASHLDRDTGGKAGHPRHRALCSFEGAEILWARLSYGRRPDGLHHSCSAVGPWMASSLQVDRRTHHSAVQKLLDEVGRSLLEASNKSERHNITRPEALAAQARAASYSPLTAQAAAQTALCCHPRGCIIHITHSWRLGNVGNMHLSGLSQGET